MNGDVGTRWRPKVTLRPAEPDTAVTGGEGESGGVVHGCGGTREEQFPCVLTSLRGSSMEQEPPDSNLAVDSIRYQGAPKSYKDAG